MNFKQKSLFVAIVTLGICVAVFQNCGQSLSEADLEDQNSTAGTGTPVTVPDPLLLAVGAASMSTSSTLAINASGGTPPYVFSVDSGPGSIIAGPFVQSGGSAGTINLRVTDAAGATTVSSVVVNAPAPAGLPCTLPWGGTIAHQASVTAYQTGTVACMGQACVSENRICINGVLSGSYTAQSCSVPACVYQWYNVTSYAESAAQTCARNGKPVAADQGYGTCASGEARPTQGAGYASISYKYGTFGGTSAGGTALLVSIDSGPRYYCYRAGQKKDGDGSDLVVAYLCRAN